MDQKIMVKKWKSIPQIQFCTLKVAAKFLHLKVQITKSIKAHQWLDKEETVNNTEIIKTSL